MKKSLGEGKEAVLELLNTCGFSYGQAFAYLVSHSQILIRYHKGEHPCNSHYLFVKDCYEVKFKDNWKKEDLTIEEIEGEYGTEFIIKDGDSLYIRSGVRPHAFVDDYPNYKKENRTRESN